MGNFYKRITGPKFAAALILLVLAALVAASVVPQAGDVTPSYLAGWRARSPFEFAVVDFLQLDRVYASAWFLTLVSAVFLLLSRTVYMQARNLLPGRAFSKEAPAFSKNVLAKWGSVIFHSGLLLVIIAGLACLCFQKRGFAQVIEGGLLHGGNRDFATRTLGAFENKFNTGFETGMTKFRCEYRKSGQVKAISSDIVLMDTAKAKKFTVSANHPVRFEGVNIYQSFHYGYVLSFVLGKRKSKNGGRGIITNFLLDARDKKSEPAVGTSGFPLTPYVFEMRFYPDVTMDTFKLGSPVLYLTVLERGIPVFSGLVIPGETIPLGRRILIWRLTSMWSGLIYTKGDGMAFAYAGFCLICLGAAMIYFSPRKKTKA